MHTELSENFDDLDTRQSLCDAIINFSDDAIYSVTLDGITTSWNKGAETIFGYTADEMLGKHISLITPGHSLREEEGILEKIKAGTHVRHYETQRRRKDGNIVNVSLTVSPLKDKNGKINGASKIARETEQKYYQLFKNNPVPTWVLDTATFRFLDVNEAAIAHYGYSRNEFLSMTALDIRPDDEKERFVNLDREKNHLGYRGGWKHKKKDGTIIHVDINLDNIIFDGKPCYLIISHDVTEKVNAENALTYTTLRLKQAQAIAHIGSWEYNFATGKVALSDEACRIYGLSPENNELSSATFLSFIHPDDIEMAMKNIIESHTSFSVVSFHYRIIRRNGATRHIYIHKARLS